MLEEGSYYGDPEGYKKWILEVKDIVSCVQDRMPDVAWMGPRVARELDLELKSIPTYSK